MKATAVLVPSIPQARPESRREAPIGIPTRQEAQAPTTQSTPLLEAEKDTENTLSSLNAIKWVADAGIRALARYAEIFCESPLLRIPVRALTETMRKFTELIGFKALSGESIGKADYKKAAGRIFENTVSSAILEPSMYTTRAVRMGVGFANAGLRVAARGLMFMTSFLEKEGLGLEHVLDEGASRTICRAIFSNSENPLIRIGASFLEQLGINFWVHTVPVLKTFNKIVKPSGTEAKADRSIAA